ncbi:CAP domain-containing protein, partial [Streptomyces sp. NPDC054808]
MGSRRAARPSRSHARPRGGLRTRGTALALGAVTLTAGVGITLAVTDGEDGGASDRVTANAADQAPNAEDAAGGAARGAAAGGGRDSPARRADPHYSPATARRARDR